MNSNVATLPDAKPFLPAPDMSLLKPERPAAPVMTDEEFATVFGPAAGWINEAAETKNAPREYVAMALVSSASAAIGNSRWVRPWDGWKEPSVIWSALVGNPSANKSPAMDAVSDALKAINKRFADEHRAAHKEWADAAEIAKLVEAGWKADAKVAISESHEPPEKPKEADAGREPVLNRLSVSDATVEKIAEILSQTWRGLMLSRDELSGWLGNMSRYSNGSDRPFWLESYGGREYTVDRKSTPLPLVVEHNTMAILGTIQPDRLQELLIKAGGDDGLLARFCVVWPDAPTLKRPNVSFDGDFPLQLMDRLLSLSPVEDDEGNRRPFFVDLTEDARCVLHQFRIQCAAWENDASGLLLSHIGKMPGLAVRFANVFAHLDWAASKSQHFPLEIDAPTLGRACHFVGNVLRLHAVRAYGGSAEAAEVRGARKLAHWIVNRELLSFTAREVQQNQFAGLSDAKRDIAPAIEVLIQGSWVTLMEGKGRRREYAVNPQLWEVLG